MIKVGDRVKILAQEDVISEQAGVNTIGCFGTIISISNNGGNRRPFTVKVEKQQPALHVNHSTPPTKRTDWCYKFEELDFIESDLQELTFNIICANCEKGAFMEKKTICLDTVFADYKSRLTCPDYKF